MEWWITSLVHHVDLIISHIPCRQEHIGGLSKDPFSPSSAPLKPQINQMQANKKSSLVPSTNMVENIFDHVILKPMRVLLAE